MKRTEHTQKWLDALRSGEYKQTRGMIQNGDKLCCIGVAATIMGVPCVGNDPYDAAKRSMGLSEHEMWHCVHMNDGVEGLRRHTFLEIADEIEKMLEPEACQ